MYLVTLCNAGDRAPKLARYVPGEGLTALKLPAPPSGAVGGATGIVRHAGGYLVALQSAEWTLAILDAGLTTARYVAVEHVGDPHGVAVFEDRAHIASTRSNQIVRLDQQYRFDTVVGQPTELLVDRDHINDMTVADGRLLASRFGAKTPAGLRDGAVFHVATGEVLARRFNEPHSVAFADGCFHLLDSATGVLFRIVPGIGPVRLAAISGYARGLLIEDERWLIGRSRQRLVSRSEAFQIARRLHATAPERRDAERAGLFDADRASGEARFWPLPGGGSEIYGICREHPSAPAPERRRPRADAGTRRTPRTLRPASNRE